MTMMKGYQGASVFPSFCSCLFFNKKPIILLMLSLIAHSSFVGDYFDELKSFSQKILWLRRDVFIGSEGAMVVCPFSPLLSFDFICVILWSLLDVWYCLGPEAFA
jgi:hypothetical protein